MPEIMLNQQGLDMHSDAWWMRALDGELTPAEQRAWEVHLAECSACRAEWEALQEMDAIFATAPAVTLPHDFTDRTLQRLDGTRSRRHWWTVLGVLALGVMVLAVEILILGTAFLDIQRVAQALLSSRDMLAQVVMRMGLGLLATGKSAAPVFMGVAALLMAIMMPNGILATAAVVVVRRHRRGAEPEF